jgi:hypothetical protein
MAAASMFQPQAPILQTTQVQDFLEQEFETLEVRVSYMNTIGKLKD